MTDKTTPSDLQAAIGDESYLLAKEAGWIPEDMTEVEFKTLYAEQIQDFMNRVADRIAI